MAALHWSMQRDRLYKALEEGDAVVVAQFLPQLAKFRTLGPDAIAVILEKAAACGHEMMITRLLDLDTSSASEAEEHALGALCKAATLGHLGAVLVILDHAVAASFDGKKLAGPLLHAVEHNKSQGYVDGVRSLLDRGALIECGSDSALHRALREWYFRPRYSYSQEIVHLLIQRANVNWTRADGWSPLYLACRGGASASDVPRVNAPVTFARALIQRGALVDTPTSLGVTPLHAAIMYMRTDCAQLLLQSGADILPLLRRISDNRGLYYRRGGPSPDMVALLRPRVEAALRDMILEEGRGWRYIGELAFLVPRICEFYFGPCL